MKRKQKPVRCWLVSWRDRSGVRYRDLYTNQKDAVYTMRISKALGMKDTITPGHFVPDAPKPKARRK